MNASRRLSVGMAGMSKAQRRRERKKMERLADPPLSEGAWGDSSTDVLSALLAGSSLSGGSSAATPAPSSVSAPAAPPQHSARRTRVAPPPGLTPPAASVTSNGGGAATPDPFALLGLTSSGSDPSSSSGTRNATDSSQFPSDYYVSSSGFSVRL